MHRLGYGLFGALCFTLLVFAAQGCYDDYHDDDDDDHRHRAFVTFEESDTFGWVVDGDPDGNLTTPIFVTVKLEGFKHLGLDPAHFWAEVVDLFLATSDSGAGQDLSFISSLQVEVADAEFAETRLIATHGNVSDGDDFIMLNLVEDDIEEFLTAEGELNLLIHLEGSPPTEDVSVTGEITLFLEEVEPFNSR